MTAYFFSRFFTRFEGMTKLLFYIGLGSTVFVSYTAIRLIIKNSGKKPSARPEAHMSAM